MAANGFRPICRCSSTTRAIGLWTLPHSNKVPPPSTAHWVLGPLWRALGQLILLRVRVGVARPGQMPPAISGCSGDKDSIPPDRKTALSLTTSGNGFLALVLSTPTGCLLRRQSPAHTPACGSGKVALTSVTTVACTALRELQPRDVQHRPPPDVISRVAAGPLLQSRIPLAMFGCSAARVTTLPETSAS